VLFEARPGRRLPLAISVGAAIYPQDGDSYESLLATADSRMYRDKTRRKQRAQIQPAATGTDGMPAVSLPLQPATTAVEITEIDLQRAGFGVL